MIVLAAGFVFGVPLLKMGVFLAVAGMADYIIPGLFLKLKRVSRQEEIRRQLNCLKSWIY